MGGRVLVFGCLRQFRGFRTLRSATRALPHLPSVIFSLRIENDYFIWAGKFFFVAWQKFRDFLHLWSATRGSASSSSVIFSLRIENDYFIWTGEFLFLTAQEPSGISHSGGGTVGPGPMDSAAFKKAGETFIFCDRPTFFQRQSYINCISSAI